MRGQLRLQLRSTSYIQYLLGGVATLVAVATRSVTMLLQASSLPITPHVSRRLDIPPGYEKLPSHLKPEMVNYPVFHKSIRTPYRWQISPDQPLPYTTLLKWMKRLGVLPQITRPYCLRYGAGNAFNQRAVIPRRQSL